LVSATGNASYANLSVNTKPALSEFLADTVRFINLLTASLPNPYNVPFSHNTYLTDERKTNNTAD